MMLISLNSLRKRRIELKDLEMIIEDYISNPPECATAILIELGDSTGAISIIKSDRRRIKIDQHYVILYERPEEKEEIQNLAIRIGFINTGDDFIYYL